MGVVVHMSIVYTCIAGHADHQRDNSPFASGSSGASGSGSRGQEGEREITVEREPLVEGRFHEKLLVGLTLRKYVPAGQYRVYTCRYQQAYVSKRERRRGGWKDTGGFWPLTDSRNYRAQYIRTYSLRPAVFFLIDQDV